MSMTTAEAIGLPATDSAMRRRARAAARVMMDLAIAYLLLLAVHAWLGQWTRTMSKAAASGISGSPA